MRRWNGWGDEGSVATVPAAALRLLEAEVGRAEPHPDAALADVVAAVPDSRLPDHPLISLDPEDRVRHARGQSLPDWIALRSGRIPAAPDAVALPESSRQVRELLDRATAPRTTSCTARCIGGCTGSFGRSTAPSAGSPATRPSERQRTDPRAFTTIVDANTSCHPCLVGLVAVVYTR